MPAEWAKVPSEDAKVTKRRAEVDVTASEDAGQLCYIPFRLEIADPVLNRLDWLYAYFSLFRNRLCKHKCSTKPIQDKSSVVGTTNTRG
jgi:hypothetical protein